MSNRSISGVCRSDDPEDDESDEEALGSSPLFCRASYFPIVRLCSRRSNQSSPDSSFPSPPQDKDDDNTVTVDEPSNERRAVRDRNGRILFYYAPLPRCGPTAGDAVRCRVSLCKSRSAGEILSTSTMSAPTVNSRFAVPLQVRRRLMEDIRQRLAADDDSNSWWRRQPSSTCRGSRLHDHVNHNQERLSDNVDEDELNSHGKQRHQRLQQAMSIPRISADIWSGVRRGGSVESECGSRSDREGSTDGSASTSTDTDHDHASSMVSFRL